MYSIKNNILYFIIFTGIVQVQSLVELREETKDLAVTEAAVRKTVNGLFSILKLDHVKHKAKLGEFAAIHNFFVTITYQDDDNLKEIVKLARVENIDNSTQRFIALFNEVLNEDNKSHEAGEDEYVTAHIETFIRKLEYLKYKYGFDNNNIKLGINTQIINHLKSDDVSQNNTKAVQEGNVGADLLNSNEFWSKFVLKYFLVSLFHLLCILVHDLLCSSRINSSYFRGKKRKDQGVSFHGKCSVFQEVPVWRLHHQIGLGHHFSILLAIVRTSSSLI